MTAGKEAAHARLCLLRHGAKLRPQFISAVQEDVRRPYLLRAVLNLEGDPLRGVAAVRALRHDLQLVVSPGSADVHVDLEPVGMTRGKQRVTNEWRPAVFVLISEHVGAKTTSRKKVAAAHMRRWRKDLHEYQRRVNHISQDRL